MTSDGSLPEVRIGDRERSAVDAVLQAALADGMLTVAEYDERSALCWSARTRTDLEPLTRDLPVAAQAEDTEDDDDDEKAGLWWRVGSGAVTLAVIAGAGYLGSQMVTAEDGFTVFGSRTQTVSPDQGRVEIGTLFGRFNIVVPDDVRVRTTGTTVFGRVDCTLACQGTGPEVVVDVRGAFGRVDILTQSQAE